MTTNFPAKLKSVRDNKPTKYVAFLQSRGVVRRVPGRWGKIVNYLREQGDPASPITRRKEPNAKPRPSVVPSMPFPPRRTEKCVEDDKPSVQAYSLPDLRSTLLVIPCSGAKASFLNTAVTGQSILDALPPNLATKMDEARRAVAPRANVDEHTLVPAWQRYDGTLYRAARRCISDLVERGTERHLMILSGGYGLLMDNEPIGMYGAVFRRSSWARGLLEEVLVAYAA